jgi:hypothetical protein|nr:MAG TPA: hypothetical protein [Caudoviricetes sp.]
MALSVQAQLKKVLAPFARAVGVDIKKLKDGKQDKLQAGLNIQISEEGVISATAPNQAPDLSAYSTTEQITTLVDGKVAGLVKEEALNTKLADYATTASVDTKLADYATTTAVDTKLADYTNTAALNTKLADYATTTSVDTKLADYTTTAALTTKLGDYATTASLTTTLADYAKAAEVQPKLTAGPGITITENNQIVATPPDLTGYVKEEALDFSTLDLVAEYEAGKRGETEAAASAETGDQAPPQ